MENISLKNYEWKGVYCSAEIDIFKEFYTPALTSAVRYDRAVGFFSSEALVANLNGLSFLIRNNGKMRLVIGHPLEEDEFLAARKGWELGELLNEVEKNLEEVIEGMLLVGKDRLSLMAYMIAQGRLDIKYAFRRKGMYHEKIGVVHDAHGNRLVFHGSPNETIYGLGAGFNAESISVYSSWDEKVYASYGAHYEEGFNKLWGGIYPNTVTIDVPSSVYERIISSLPSVSLKDISEEDYSKKHDVFFDEGASLNLPAIPDKMGGSEFCIKPHQREAVRQWVNGSYKGILKLSTGSGKTISSLYAVTKVYEARKRAGKKTALIVSVPYKELASQWVDNLNIFNMYPVKCWESKSLWRVSLEKEVLDFTMSAIDFLSIVVVNRTMEGEAFGKAISSLPSDSIFFIGDECHNHGADKTSRALPNAYYRMGLSATPYRSDDDEIESIFPNDAKNRIEGYYGGVVAEYSLGDAINDGVLCEYDYHIVPVLLTENEQDEYEEISNEIARLLAFSSGKMSKSVRDEFTRLCGQRSRLLGSANNKLVELERLCKAIPYDKRKKSLFYCGEGRFQQSEDGSDLVGTKIIDEVSSILSECGWHTSRFTSEESSIERKRIMENFVGGSIDALVSMKVLDEGVDVPVCDKAFILASTRNPRQYIQRRGRVLRKHKNKSHAEIYDFVIIPTNDSLHSMRLKQAELERVDDFILLARNRFEVEEKIDHLGIRKEYEE